VGHKDPSGLKTMQKWLPNKPPLVVTNGGAKPSKGGGKKTQSTPSVSGGGHSINASVSVPIFAAPQFSTAGGQEAHAIMEAYFMAYYAPSRTGNQHAEVEEYVRTGSNTPTGAGYADMVYYDFANSIIEVYEIKPISYMTNASQNIQGITQLQGYVDGLGTAYPEVQKVTKGDSFNPTGIAAPSVVHPGYYIQYYVGDDAGMIYYAYVTSPSPEREVVSIPIAEPREEAESAAAPAFNRAPAVDWADTGWGLLSLLMLLLGAFGTLMGMPSSQPVFG
jgi:hypothetical protein